MLNELSSYPTPETPISNKLERSATSQELLAPGRAPLRRAATLLGTRPSSAKALEDAWFKVEHVTQLAAHAPEIVKQLEAFAKMNAMQRVAHQLLASELNEGVSPRNHFGGDQWGRSPRSSASTSPMFSTQQTHFAPAADPEKDPVAALGLLASTPLLDRRAQPSPPPRYRSLSKPNSPQKEKTNWEEKTS